MGLSSLYGYLCILRGCKLGKKWTVTFDKTGFVFCLGVSLLDLRKIDGHFTVYFDLGFYSLVFDRYDPKTIDCGSPNCCGQGCHDV